MRISVPANSAASSPINVCGFVVSSTESSTEAERARGVPSQRNPRSDPGRTAMHSVPPRRTSSPRRPAQTRQGLRHGGRTGRLGGPRPPSVGWRGVRSPGGRHDPDEVHPELRSSQMAGNRGVAYIEPGKVEVHETDYPKLELLDGPGVNPANVGRQLEHGVILKVVTTNICGSDQHMVRGRTTAPPNLVLGHEILGEVVEKGRDVEFIKVGDLCSVPFNIACGRCRNCKEGKTGICLNVNPARPGAAYGYVDMGGWVGGQAEYVM